MRVLVGCRKMRSFPTQSRKVLMNRDLRNSCRGANCYCVSNESKRSRVCNRKRRCLKPTDGVTVDTLAASSLLWVVPGEGFEEVAGLAEPSDSRLSHLDGGARVSAEARRNFNDLNNI